MFSLGVILYILNFGIPPWKISNAKQCGLYKRFVETRQKFWKLHPATRKLYNNSQLDDQMLDLMDKLCKQDAFERPNSLEEVLKHPYL